MSEGQLALDDQHRAIPKHGKIAETAEQRGGRVHRSRSKNGVETRADKAGVAFLPFPARGLFDVAGFEGLNAGERFDEVRLRFCAFLGAAADLGLQDRRSKKRDASHEWHDEQGHDRQLHIVEKHDRHVDDRKQRIEAHSQRGAGEELADVFQLMQARGNLAHGSALKVAEREFVEVVHDPRADGEVDAVRGVHKEVGANRREGHGGDGEQDEKNSEDIQGIDGILDENLVDDHLSEQRVRQPEQLDKKRGDENLDQHALVLADRRQEPPEAELFLLLFRKWTEEQHLDLGRKAALEILHRSTLEAGARIGERDTLGACLEKHAHRAFTHEQGRSLDAPKVHRGHFDELRGEAGHRGNVAAGVERRLAIRRNFVRQNPACGFLRKFLCEKLRQHSEAGDDFLERAILRGKNREIDQGIQQGLSRRQLGGGGNPSLLGNIGNLSLFENGRWNSHASQRPIGSRPPHPARRALGDPKSETLSRLRMAELHHSLWQSVSDKVGNLGNIQRATREIHREKIKKLRRRWRFFEALLQLGLSIEKLSKLGRLDHQAHAVHRRCGGLDRKIPHERGQARDATGAECLKQFGMGIPGTNP